MKKTYIKPYIAVETFQLNAAIAASCSSLGLDPINHTIATCTLNEEEPGFGYFGVKCLHDVMSYGDGNDLICYHGPGVEANSVYMNS